MKKTLTVNLNNIVFHIDDDAYEMLQTYLSEIADHFKQDDERKEIMNDIEARIAELFNEKLQKSKNVINLSDVEEIVEIMGKPSQYAEDEEAETSPKTDKKQQKSRRFYRDPENAILGGIAGGLAAYFNLDVTLIRIILVVLVFLGVGFIIPIYIVVWFVAPAALTASQRLEMQGEDVTVENIKTEVSNVKNYMESEKFKQSATSVGKRIGEILIWFFKIIFGFVGAIIGLAGFVVIGALILALFVMLFEPSAINGLAPGFISDWAAISPEKMVLMVISLILLIGSPIFLLIYWAAHTISGRRTTSHTASWVVLILWIAGLFMFYSVGANTFFHFHNHNRQSFYVNWNDDNKPFENENRKLGPFYAIDISGNFELTLKKDSVQEINVSSPTNFLSKVVTKVENGVLYIYSDGISLNRPLKVTVSYDSIKSLVAKGACKITNENQIVISDFTLDLLGASEADLDMKVTGQINVNTKGASKVDLKGSCNKFKLNGLGASQIEAGDLIAKVADVYVAGATHAQVHATESLNAEAYGASGIGCKGHPKNVKKTDNIASSINIE
jgi:phage shock protein PspC (stress-responsive transcriptional regulator)